MDLVNFLTIKALYFTPFGYLLSIFHIINQSDQFGLKLIFPPQKSRESVKIVMTPNPSLQTRFNWLTNGVVLLMQAVLPFFIRHDIDWGSRKENMFVIYITLCCVFGITQIVCAIFPNTDWNKKILP